MALKKGVCPKCRIVFEWGGTLRLAETACPLDPAHGRLIRLVGSLKPGFISMNLSPRWVPPAEATT